MTKKAKETNSLKKKSIKDLAGIIADSYKALGNARFSAAGSRAKNTVEGKKAQKTIARAKTELKAREMAEATQEAK